MSCFFIGENTQMHEVGEMLQERMNQEHEAVKESYRIRLKRTN